MQVILSVSRGWYSRNNIPRSKSNIPLICPCFPSWKEGKRHLFLTPGPTGQILQLKTYFDLLETFRPSVKILILAEAGAQCAFFNVWNGTKNVIAVLGVVSVLCGIIIFISRLDAGILLLVKKKNNNNMGHSRRQIHFWLELIEMSAVRANLPS